MPTISVQTLIDNSAKDLGCLASGESLAPEEYTDAVFRLNGILESWDVQRLNIYTTQLAQYGLTANRTTPYLIGTGGGADFNAARPTSVRTATWVLNGLRYKLRPLSLEEWEAITEQGRVGQVIDAFYYDNNYPNAGIYLSPWPSSAGLLELGTWEQFSVITWNVPNPPSGAPNIILPPAYQRALELTLAVEM